MVSRNYLKDLRKYILPWEETHRVPQIGTIPAAQEPLEEILREEDNNLIIPDLEEDEFEEKDEKQTEYSPSATSVIL